MDLIDEIRRENPEEFLKQKQQYNDSLLRAKARDLKFRVVFLLEIVVSIILLAIGIIDVVIWKVGVMGVICPIVSLVIDTIPILMSFRYNSKR